MLIDVNNYGECTLTSSYIADIWLLRFFFFNHSIFLIYSNPSLIAVNPFQTGSGTGKFWTRKFFHEIKPFCSLKHDSIIRCIVFFFRSRNTRRRQLLSNCTTEERDRQLLAFSCRDFCRILSHHQEHSEPQPIRKSYPVLP